MNFFRDREPVALKPVEYPSTTEVEEVVNTHTHPRDTDAEKDGRAEMHIPRLAKVYGIALCMGNTNPPLITVDRALAKGVQWRAIVPKGTSLQLKIGGLLTETTTPEEVVRGYDQPEGKTAWDYMKMFVRAASNSHGADVDDLRKIVPVLKAMTYTKFVHRKHPMTLAIHMERKYDLFGRRVGILERERTSVERDLSFLFSEVPDARIVVCHVTDRYTLEVIRYLRSKGFNVWGEIAPHYSALCHDDLFEAADGGTKLNATLFCLPVFKSEEDQRAILAAMLSGEPWWIHGCDEACWPDYPVGNVGAKIDTLGMVTGGETQDPAANLSYIIEKFAEANKLDLINGYLSRNAREAYGLGPAQTTKLFKREDWTVPEILSRDIPHGRIEARVAMGGQKRKYVPA